MSKGEVQLTETPGNSAVSWGRAEQQKQTGCVSFKQVVFHLNRFFISFLWAHRTQGEQSGKKEHRGQRLDNVGSPKWAGAGKKDRIQNSLVPETQKEVGNVRLKERKGVKMKAP